jgi:hypothetical protein
LDGRIEYFRWRWYPGESFLINQFIADHWRILLAIFLSAIVVFISPYAVEHKSLIILMVLGVVTEMMLLSRRPLVLVLFCILASMLPYSITLGGADIQIYYLLILVMIWVLLFNDQDVGIFWRQGANGWLLLFLAIMVLNYFRNPGLPGILTGTSGGDKIRFGYFLLSLTLLSGYLIMPYVFKTSIGIRTLIGTVAAISVVGLVFAWLYYFFGVRSPFIPGYAGQIFQVQAVQGAIIRFGAIGGYATYLWPFMLVFVPNRQWLLKVALGLFLIVSVIISGARAQLVDLIVSALVYFSIVQRSPYFLVAASVPLLVAFVAIFQSGITDQMPQLQRFSLEYTQRQVQTIVEGASASRLGIYQVSWKLTLQNPVLGIGPATEFELKQLQTIYSNFVYFDARAGVEAAFANISVIYGLPALLIFSVAIYTALRRAFAVFKRSEISENRQIILYCILFTVIQLLDNLVSGSASGGGLYFYIVLGLIDILFIRLASQHTSQKLENVRQWSVLKD